jgi:hypothetical protein
MNMAKKFLISARCCFFILCLLCLYAVHAGTEEIPLRISNISLDKKTFSSDKDGSVKITYKLSKDAAVTVNIYDESDRRIRTLGTQVKTAAGFCSAEWDGKDDEGKFLPSGAYIYTLEAVSDAGEKTKYDPADQTGGILLEIRKPVLDTEKGEISYVLPKAGMVRIRAGIKEGPHLRTLIDWIPREAGANFEKWDGKDKAGLIDLFQIPKREVYIFAYSLPDNCMILKSNAANQDRVSADKAEYRLKTEGYADPKYKHALHEKAICHEPEFEVTFPQSLPRTAEGIPIVEENKPVPVKVSISEKDRRHIESARFEVMFFVDTVFLFEDEEGFTPFTYIWNTQGLSPGEHVFTVNIMSYDDHCGVETQKVMIRR